MFIYSLDGFPLITTSIGDITFILFGYNHQNINSYKRISLPDRIVDYYIFNNFFWNTGVFAIYEVNRIFPNYWRNALRPYYRIVQ